MLTERNHQDHITGTTRLKTVSTNHQFAPVETANAADYGPFGMAPPSARSRRAARARRRARHDSGGWRSGIAL